MIQGTGNNMKVGSLVRSTTPGNTEEWIGIIIGWDTRGDSADPIVMWNEIFPDEVEYKEQLEVIQ